MKKLLLVLMVVALASFLMVGCLGEGTVVDDDDDDDDDVIPPVEAAITVENEYTNVGGVTFVACKNADDDPSVITVTLPAPVEVDYVVYVAVKTWDGTEYIYEPKVAATPNPARTVWTVDDFPWSEYGCDDDPYICLCEPICLVAIVQHPCCPGEEVALKIVTVDCTPPELDLLVKFTDCEDECVDPDPCDPPVPGMSMEWTSRTSDACDTLDCCEDTCSLVNGWSLVIDPDECLGPCDTIPGTGCPVEGVLECGCLDYAPDTSEDVCYYVDFSFEDNVGNAVTSRWKLCFDTDELVSFEVDDDYDTTFSSDRTLTATDDWYQVYDMSDCPEF